MKAILMSIRPQHTCNILNLIKLWEIRKKFPSDYVGWVYIYCTKNGGNFGSYKGNMAYGFSEDNIYWQTRRANGKVVARFWCDKVELAYKFYVEELCQLACITKDELYEYAGDWYKTDDLLAIHITKLEIFDKPKEISEFIRDTGRRMLVGNDLIPYCEPLTRAPQSWCYIEI